jgi:hypothetical protein
MSEILNDPSNPKDPFDPEQLRLSQDFGATLGVKKQLITVPVRKPDRQWFVRTHPDEGYRLQVGVIELRDEREVYVVDPSIHAELPGEVVPTILVTAISRQGVLFLWPVRLPSPDGRQNEWHRTLLEGANMAREKWVKVVANMSLGAYEVFEATGDLPEPEWPDIPFRNLLQIAFRHAYIDSVDHIVIRRLRGEV